MTETIDFAVPGGYELSEDRRLIDIDTGEMIEAVPTLLPNGTRIRAITPHVQERINHRRAAEARIKQIQITNEELGKFYFVRDDLDFSGIRSETLTRVLYLYTYLTPDREIKIRRRGDALIVRGLKDALGVTKNTADAFWKEVDGVFFVEEDGKIYGLCNKSIFSGKIKWKKDDTAFYQRVYRDGVRKLYKATRPSQHKQLGHVLAMLPYINHEYNVLCKNPDETDKDCIEVMSLMEFGQMIKYDESNLSRLRKSLASIRFIPEGKDKKEPFVAFVQTGNGASDVKIVVNPRIIYGGQDYKKVEAFELFFK